MRVAVCAALMACAAIRPDGWPGGPNAVPKRRAANEEPIMRCHVLPSLLVAAALSAALPAGFLASAQAAVDFPQSNAIAFNPPSLPAADGTVEAGQPTLNQRDDGYETLDFSYTVTANRTGPIDVVWSASRNFNLDPKSSLTGRIKGDAKVSLSANSTASLSINGYVNGISPANLSFLSGNISGPQNQLDVVWDRTSEPMTQDAGNDQSLQMDFGVNWFPQAVGDQITISTRAEVRITQAVPVGVSGPGAVEFAVRAIPNPVPGALVRFTVALPNEVHVRLEMYDLRGRRIASIIDRTMDAGSHAVEWAAKDVEGRRLAPGLYFFRLTAGVREQRGRLVLLNH